MTAKMRSIFIFGFAVLIVFIGMIAGVGGYYINNGNRLFSKTYTNSVAAELAAEKANADLIAIHRAMKDVALSESGNSIATKASIDAALLIVNNTETDFYKQLSFVKELSSNDTYVNDVLVKYEEWKPIRQNTINFTLAGDYKKAAENTKTFGAQKVIDIQNKLDVLVEAKKIEADAQYNNSKIQVQNSFYTLIILTIVAGILAIIISFFVYKIISNYQKQLRAERENLKVTLRSIGDGVISTDLDRNIIFLNDSAEIMTGYSRDEAIGKKFKDVFNITNEKTGEPASCPVEEVLSTGEICELANHTMLTAKDGVMRHIADSAAPIKDKDGVSTGVVMVFRDVTEKKELEDKLRESEAHYKMLFNAMINGYAYHKMIYDENGQACDYRYVDLNEAFEKMTGLTKSTVIGKSVKELLPNLENEWINTYAEVVRTGNPVTYENFSKDLNKHFLVYAFRPQEGHFAVVIQDITEKKNMEKEIFDEKERLRITFSSIGDGVITTDTARNVTMLNQMAEEFTGWTNEEAVGEKFTTVFNITNETTGLKAIDPVEEVLEKDIICELANHTLLKGKDGKIRHIADSAAPIKGEDGLTTGVVMVFRDVTEKKAYTDKIEFLSYHDSLTNLFNRAYFEKELKRIESENIAPASIIMGDVNGLKLLNDVYGHEAGDKLLIKIADILREYCAGKGVIARWGGDEFTVILPFVSKDEVAEICNNIKLYCDGCDFEPIILSIALGFSTRLDPSKSMKMVLKDAEDRMYTHKLVEGKSARSTIISSLQKTLSERSCETEEHANRMWLIAKEFGNHLNLTDYEMDEMKLLTLLHDVGKIGITDSILNKPGKLTEEEWYEMRKHPEIGYRIAQSTTELSHIAELILTHHEKWDGSGYPQRLSGEKIPKLARILTIIDAYDVMTNVRPYKECICAEKAKEEIIRCSGTHFDPCLVDVFVNKII